MTFCKFLSCCKWWRPNGRTRWIEEERRFGDRPRTICQGQDASRNGACFASPLALCGLELLRRLWLGLVLCWRARAVRICVLRTSGGTSPPTHDRHHRIATATTDLEPNGCPQDLEALVAACKDIITDLKQQNEVVCGSTVAVWFGLIRVPFCSNATRRLPCSRTNCTRRQRRRKTRRQRLLPRSRR
jgi:hypothetical protein